MNNNPNDKSMEIKAPEFTPPKEWNIKITPNKAPENGNIKLKPGENELKYTLSGKSPDKERSGDIKVAFAGKTLTIALKLLSIVIKETGRPKELIVGKNSRGEKLEFTLTSLSEGVDGYSPIDIPKFMTIAGQNKGLSVKLEGSSSLTLKKGKEAKVTYAIEGAPEGDGDAIIKINIAGEIKIPIRYLKADEASFKLVDDSSKIEKNIFRTNPFGYQYRNHPLYKTSR